ncbi:ABC-2 transporter permease [Herbiconiux daphne]|uniref:DUF3533 domain-containing protein n=1 Tax=Herbiconiux daphne TaxID=2970914 RepID=A0ABT2GWE2_9MICO|nr:hypothetical protein [Herbiconiux daphne]MCS5732285.1 hypothetical protein [Herbiconiux daphne]
MVAPSPSARGWSFARGLVSGPNRPAFVVALIVAVFAALFVASYSLALGDPQPHDVPIGEVTGPMSADQLEEALEDVSGTSFDVSSYPSLDAAKAAVEQQLIYAVFDSSAGAADGAPAGTPSAADLYVSSASGASVARLIEDDATSLGQKLGVTITVTDLNPLNPNDPNGLVMFYVALGSIVLGFVGAVQTRVNAPHLTLGGELAWDAVRAVLVGGIVALTIGPILHFDDFPFVPVWAVLTATVFVAGTVYSFFRVAIGGQWALLPTWVLFVLISNPSSGGAVASQLQPPFFEFVGRWLPTGATVRALRDLTYFPGSPHPEPYLVLGGWLVASIVAFVMVRRRKYGLGRIP